MRPIGQKRRCRQRKTFTGRSCPRGSARMTRILNGAWRRRLKSLKASAIPLRGTAVSLTIGERILTMTSLSGKKCFTGRKVDDGTASSTDTATTIVITFSQALSLRLEPKSELKRSSIAHRANSSPIVQRHEFEELARSAVSTSHAAIHIAGIIYAARVLAGQNSRRPLRAGFAASSNIVVYCPTSTAE